MGKRQRPARLVLALAGVVAAGGCAMGYAAGGGPTVTTRGEAGVVAALSGSFGIAVEDLGLVETLRVELVPPGLTSMQVGGGGGFDLVSGAEDDYGWRLGIRTRILAEFPDWESVRLWYGSGLSLALLAELEDDGDGAEYLGVALEPYAMFAEGPEDDPEGGEWLGLLVLTLTYEYWWIDDLSDLFSFSDSDGY